MLNQLLEIRQRALIVLSVFVVLFILCFFYANTLFHVLVSPLLRALPRPHSLIATQVTASVLIPLHLAAMTAMIGSTPVALFHFWRFLMPALYPHERYQLRRMIGLSLALFALGLLFCFYVVLPFMFQFFMNVAPSDVKMMPDMSYAVDFITKMLFLFGACFQIPLFCLVLVRLQWLDVSRLRAIRPYIIVMAFILGMLLTPPDVFSQIMLAIPLCLLYELGILLCSWETRALLSH